MTIHSEKINKIQEGTSYFWEYQHHVSVHYSYLDHKGRWIQPQNIGTIVDSFSESRKKDIYYIFSDGRYQAVDEESQKYDYENKLADYYKRSKTYYKIYPTIQEETGRSRLGLHYVRYRKTEDQVGSNFNETSFLYFEVDLLKNKIHNGKDIVEEDYDKITYDKSLKLIIDNNTTDNVLVRNGEPAFSDKIGLGKLDHSFNYQFSFNGIGKLISGIKSDVQKTDLSVIPKSPEYKADDIISYLFNLGQEQYLISDNTSDDGDLRKLIRVTTSTLDDLGDNLFRMHLDDFLKISSSQEIAENDFLARLEAGKIGFNKEDVDHLDFDGPYGNYFHELFFHIPFLIADHLNAEGKYKEADWWYKRIFDPTATDTTVSETDQYWQFLPFRYQRFPRYSQMLSERSALDTFAADPFNPHGIARFRPSAYQKAIFTKYIDNLLDWGDQLFRQFSMESVSEALSIYILAQDLLGDRPQELEKCETVTSRGVSYNNIRTRWSKSNSFLMYLENATITSIQSGAVHAGSPMITNRPIEFVPGVSSQPIPIEKTSGNDAVEPSLETVMQIFQKEKDESLLFCVPLNKELLAFWDRVEDRLYKIRHCMNIDGIRQLLALLAPPRNPMALIQAQASGLSMEDAIASLNAPVPAYRFTYMLEKARVFVGTVQSLGGALLSALEKKDGEELNLLRSVHERHILDMTMKVKKRQIEESEKQIENLEKLRDNITKRLEHYKMLVDKNLNSWEITQQSLTHTANLLAYPKGALKNLAGVLAQIPQLGAPTAITFGGEQLKEMAEGAAGSLDAIQSFLHGASSSAGIVASNVRRKQEWEFQRDSAERELAPIDKQIEAANIRLAIAEKDLEIHRQQIEQSKELYDFYKAKFTNLKLYNFMSSSLHKLYNQTYQMAFNIAQQAQRCYQFEINDVNGTFIKPDNWDVGRAGLLAGEKLLFQIQQMENAWLENSGRREEITQTFSLRMIDPQALILLQQNGSCTFTIPETAFDLYYPGHYSRKITALRISIPCVTGPYNNVACRVSLLSSKIRTQPKAGPDYLFAGPHFANGSISTSTANNDGGQFELNFQDIKYLPFEGGGAADSQWSLSLPSAFRSFDYKTISDVLIHISYTAKYDSTLRTVIEGEIEEMYTRLNDQSLYRLINVEEEFPDIFYQLLQSTTSTAPVQVELDRHHFPYLFQQKNIEVVDVQAVTGVDRSVEKIIAGQVLNDPSNLPALLQLNGDHILEMEGQQGLILLVEYNIS